jgi:valine--pyruvate aminotransferase
MELSAWGTKMAGLSGIRSILADIAATTGGGSGTEWLNLSPGNPAHIPEVVETWRRLEADALASTFAESSGRYGPSRGTDALLDAIAGYFNRRYGWDIGSENVLVGPGSQMLCFIATSIFTGAFAARRRQLVLASVPDYTGYQGLCLEEGGIVGVEPRVELHGDRYFRYSSDRHALRRQSSPGMILLSSPCNPTGRSIEADELAALIRIAEENDIPLVIDHAYGEPFPAIAETAVRPPLHPNVINSFTLSKAGLPGERIGFVIGAAQPISAMVSFMANTTLHAPQLIQAVVAQSLDSGELDALTSNVITPYYRNKRRVAERLLHENMPSSVNWRLHPSEGGMFCWLWIDHDWFDDLRLYDELKQKKVLIVPGRHFFVAPFRTSFLATHGTRCIRLSVSADESIVGEGIYRIAETLRGMSRAQ